MIANFTLNSFLKRSEKLVFNRSDWAPEGDFALCTALDQVPFAVVLGRSGEGWLELRRWSA